MPASEMFGHSLVMKILAAAIVWFLASWFVYDITAFIVGMPRQATPLVALAIAGTVVLVLRLTSLDRSRLTLEVGTLEPNLPRFN